MAKAFAHGIGGDVCKDYGAVVSSSRFSGEVREIVRTTLCHAKNWQVKLVPTVLIVI